ncbi:MAG TPA: SLBB domain-containing protein [Armatimonadota bacterium]|jgi:polysaccharide export outer membrane protein
MHGRRASVLRWLISLCALAILAGRPALAREYVITSGDALSVKTVGEPDYTRSYTVTDDGKIFITNIGSVTVNGKTADEVQADLTKKIGVYVKNPVVTVEITSPTNTSVWVSGEVKSPGEIKVKPDARLIDVIQKAGGLTDNADRTKTVLQRRSEPQPIPIDLDALIKGDLTKNLLVEVGDTLYIPKKAEGKIKILGEVTSAGEKDFKQKITPMEAVTLAGGFKEGADKTAVTVQHKDGTRLTVDLDAESRGEDSPLTQNLYLQEDDVVFVPNNKNIQIHVIGPGVKTPGDYTFESGMTVQDAIAKAGGSVDRARLDQVKVLRKNGPPSEVDFLKYVRKGDMTQNPALAKGDTVWVEQKPEPKQKSSGLETIMTSALSSLPSIFLWRWIR